MISKAILGIHFHRLLLFDAAIFTQTKTNTWLAKPTSSHVTRCTAHATQDQSAQIISIYTGATAEQH